jgi:hypothetical protein
MNLKRSLLVVTVAAVCVAPAWQQQPKKYVILDDKKGGFKIFDVESFEGGWSEGRYSFEAEGSPMRGFSQQQGLTFSMRALAGTAAAEGGSYRIRNGRASGNVVADTVTKEGPDESRSHIESGALTIAEGASDTTITFPGAFTFTNRVTTPTTDRDLQLRAPGGTFVLPLLDQSGDATNPFRSANVRGPVDVTVVDKKKVADGVTTHHLKVRANVLTYNGQTRTLRLEGDLSVELTITPAKGEPQTPVMQGEWLEILLDENSAVTDIRSGAGGVRLKQGGGR